VQTQSWQEVTRFYRDIAGKNSFFRPIMELAEQIAASRYSSGLYPWTSMPLCALAELRRRTIEKSLNPFRISLGNRRVYTTFAIELKTLR
jgi:hypothetical protein